jgi:type IV fimbrial biogenesis protein FimT
MIDRSRGAPGFGLVEIVVCLAIAAIAVALAAPFAGEFVARARVTAVANDLLHAVGAARIEAVRRSGAVALCRAAAGGDAPPQCATSGNDWTAGWLIVAGDGSAAAPPLQVRQSAAASVAVTFNAPAGSRIVFTAEGQPVGSFAGGTFRVCPTGRPDLGRAVVVSRGGRPRVVAEPCAA